MKIHHVTVEEAFASLQSGPNGLSMAEAEQRLAEFGANVLEPVQDEPLARKFLKSFTHFFAIILWVAAGLAFVAEVREPGQGMATLGCAIIGVILINGAFSFWQEHRAEKALAALQKLLPHQVNARRAGKVRSVAAGELVPGDVVWLQAGDKVPADFGTAPIPLAVWLFIVPFALGALALEELRKWIVRGVRRSRELHLGAMNHANV